MYNVTEYQYQQLKNYYPNCSVVAEIGRQPLKEESPNTDVQQLKAEIATLIEWYDIPIELAIEQRTVNRSQLLENLRQLSAI